PTSCPDNIKVPGKRYRTLDEAALAALSEAWRQTRIAASAGADAEYGGKIYQLGPEDYRFVAPISGPARRIADYCPNAGELCRGAGGAVDGKAMMHAYNRETSPLSCLKLEPEIVATYHSHPAQAPDTFLSINDLNLATDSHTPIYMIGK